MVIWNVKWDVFGHMMNCQEIYCGLFRYVPWVVLSYTIKCSRYLGCAMDHEEIYYGLFGYVPRVVLSYTIKCSRYLGCAMDHEEIYYGLFGYVHIRHPWDVPTYGMDYQETYHGMYLRCANMYQKGC